MKYVKIGSHGCACAECCKSLEPDDLVTSCSDCGAIICKACAEAGALDSHVCEPDDLDGEEDW